MKSFYENGFYWIRYRRPVVDSGGVLDDSWGMPCVAQRIGLDWFTSDMGAGPIVDQFTVEVLGERLMPPLVDDEEMRVWKALYEVLQKHEIGGLLVRVYAAIESATGRRVSDVYCAKGDEVVYWRGSVADLLTDLSPLMTPDQLRDLAAEAAFVWKKRASAL